MSRWKSFDHTKHSAHILVGSKYCEPYLGNMGMHVLLQLNMMRHHQTWYNMTRMSIHDGHAVIMRHVLIWTRNVRNKCRIPSCSCGDLDLEQSGFCEDFFE